ncbi:MAG: YdcF family protein [Verrucomicrobiota bacterium]|jgi:uncharacterized SAM-binding protein YcdF (DUF218 family)
MTQFFAPLAEPIGALWFLLVLGVLWLLRRRQWRSAVWLGFPMVALFAIGSTPLAEKLVASEERPWADGAGAARLPKDAADAVVALGGGYRVSPEDALGFATEDGGSRILTAVQLVRLGKARTLVLGGSGPMPDRPNVPSMCLVQDWVTSWGLAGSAVTNLGICINTHDEAIAFGKLAQDQGWLKVVMVTSALHMRRSVALFKKQGIDFIPVAADFQVQGVSQGLPFSPFPRQHRLFLMTLYLRERIGWWVYRARGWV